MRTGSETELIANTASICVVKSRSFQGCGGTFELDIAPEGFFKPPSDIGNHKRKQTMQRMCRLTRHSRSAGAAMKQAHTRSVHERTVVHRKA